MVFLQILGNNLINIFRDVYIETTRNIVVASPRGLIALIENNYQEDGSILTSKVLRPYMVEKKKLKISS